MRLTFSCFTCNFNFLGLKKCVTVGTLVKKSMDDGQMIKKNITGIFWA